MRTSLSGSLMDVAAVLNEHKLNWVSINNVFVSGRFGSVSVYVEVSTIEMLGELAKRMRVGRKQLEIKPAGTDQLDVRFKARGLWWLSKTDLPRSQAELIGVDGETIAKLPAPKLIALPAPKRKRKPALIPPSLFGGDA